MVGGYTLDSITPAIHRSAWKGNSPKFVYDIMHSTGPVGGALGDYPKSLMRWVVIPTSLAQVPRRAQALRCCEFWVSSRHLLCGVSLPWGGTTGVGVDERVEGASRRLTWFVLLDVDQVEQAAPPVRPLVEPHGNVASFDDLNQASDEVEAVRKVSPLPVS